MITTNFSTQGMNARQIVEAAGRAPSLGWAWCREDGNQINLADTDIRKTFKAAGGRPLPGKEPVYHQLNWSDMKVPPADRPWINDHLDAVEGILRAALWGACVWLAFAALMVIAWGLMA